MIVVKKRKGNNLSPKTIVVSVIGFIFVVILASLVGSLYYTVDEGEAAVVTRGGAITTVAFSGFHFKAPIVDEPHFISARQQVVKFENEQAYTTDQQIVTLNFSVNYTVIKAENEIRRMYAEYQSLSSFEAKFLERQIRDRVKNVIGRYSSEKAIRERGKLSIELNETVLAIRSDLIKIEGINIENIDLSDAIETAAENRAREEMNVQTKLQELEKEKVDATIKVTQSQAEADSTLAKETARAKGIKLVGEAEASAIKAKADALAASPNLVEYQKALSWNGQLPTTMVPGGAVPLLNLK